MTTADEFLQFAQELGLGQVNNATEIDTKPTGLTVLKNLCLLIEQIHELKNENDRLRSQLALANELDSISSRRKRLNSSNSMLDEERILVSSPKECPRSKRSPSKRNLKNSNDTASHLDEASSILQLDQETVDQNSGNSLSNWQNWIRVRHALKFTLRRKSPTATSPNLSQNDRLVPTINVSIESEEENFRGSKQRRKFNKSTLTIDETDHDDEPSAVSSNNQRTNESFDDESNLSRKKSKIARYRRKIQSKFDTVKKQFSEPISGSSTRFFNNFSALTFDEIASSANHATLTAQLAPALTKSYQEKMRQWETMQKSQFLVNYRRQSLTTKCDSSEEKRASFSIPLESIVDGDASIVEEVETGKTPLSPILSREQRALIVVQWRRIMTEEIFLRRFQENFSKQKVLVEKLEENLKVLKKEIFFTAPIDRTRSAEDIEKIHSPLERSRSVQSFSSLPASWILAVQSAAYSDILDGTTEKTSRRAVRFHKNFFDQLENFHNERNRFLDEFVQTFGDEKEMGKRKVSHRCRIRKNVQASIEKFDLLEASKVSTVEETNKKSKRSRFDFRQSFQRSKSNCISQFSSWLERRRQHRKSTATFLGSPRLARLHRRFFKSSTNDNGSNEDFTREIYSPPFSMPLTRHQTRIESIEEQNRFSPILTPKISAQQRRQSFVTMSNFHQNQSAEKTDDRII